MHQSRIRRIITSLIVHEIKQDTSNMEKTLKKYALIAAVISLCLPLVYFVDLAVDASKYFNGFPIDGFFQTYNPLRRMLLGEIPGVDFPVFTGIGLPYVLFIPFYLFGANFAASQFTVVLLTGGLFPILNWWFLKRLGFTQIIALCYSCLITIYALHNYAFDPIVHPGNDNLGLRSSIVIVAAIAIHLIGNLKLSNRGYLPEILYGGVVGISLSYSTEYGIAAMIALILLTLLNTRYSLGSRLVATLSVIFSAVIFAFISFTILSVGHPTKPMIYAFIDVPQDQFWYFGGPPNPFISSLDYYFHLPKYVYLGTVETVLALWFYATKRTPQSLAAAFLLLATLLSGLISSLGIANQAYFFPFKRAVMIVFPVIVVQMFRLASNFNPPALASRVISNLSKRLFQLILPFFCVILAGFEVTSSIRTSYTPPEQPSFYSESFGLTLGPLYVGTRDMEKFIQSRADKMNVHANQYILFSTYATALEMLLGTKQPTGFDYIIHALGTQNRQAYVKTFEQSKPLFVTTIRPSFTPYETWLRMTTWPFYKALFLHYKPVYHSTYQTLWERTGSTSIANIPVHVLQAKLVGRRDEDLVYEIDTHSIRKSQILDVHLEYSIDYSPLKLPYISKLPRIIVSPTNSADNFAFAIPPYQNNVSFPLLTEPNTDNTYFDIYIQPALGSSISKTKCIVTELPIPSNYLLQ